MRLVAWLFVYRALTQFTFTERQGEPRETGGIHIQVKYCMTLLPALPPSRGTLDLLVSNEKLEGLLARCCRP